MNFNKEFKEAYNIRKVERFFLEMFKLGKISGTVHTCIGQELTGIFATKNSIKGDCVVSNHRGHGHYLAFTHDFEGLIGELLGKSNGCSKGIGGSQHLQNGNFYSNGIQGGMLPIAAGMAQNCKMAGNNNISIAFMGDGTLGEGIVYETFNISSLWEIPIVYILEKNNIAQSTSFEQNFSGNIRDRIEGFNIKFYNTSVYDISNIDTIFREAFLYARENSKPVFIEVEVGRLNSHSKGDDNRDEKFVDNLIKKDILNIFVNKNDELVKKWDEEIEGIIKSAYEVSNSSKTIDNRVDELVSIEKKDSDHYSLVDLGSKSKIRFNQLIYNELEKIMINHENACIIGEDIENNNLYNPREYGGAFKVTKDLSNKYPKRVKNTPISEQAITGLGIGMSLMGSISIVEIMFGDFLTLTLDQLLQHVSKFTMMYGIKIKIPFIIRTPMGGFRGYGPTHSQSLEKHFLGIPGLKVIVLNQLIEPEKIFQKIIKFQSPVLLIENKTLYTKTLYANFISGYHLKINNPAEAYPVIRLVQDEAPDLTVVCYGGIVDEVLSAAEILFIDEEITLDIFIVTDLTSSFVAGLKSSVSGTKKLCFVEEGSSFVSFSSEVTANLVENAQGEFALLRIANNWIIPSSRERERNILPHSNSIKQKIIKFLYE